MTNSDNERRNKRKPGPLVSVKGGPVLAVIDLGTNSFHMIVCRATDERDHFEVITRAKEAVPFFRRSLTAHYIDEQAMRSAVRIVKDMQKNAVNHGATSIIAVATSAVRESRNGRDFLENLNSELKVDARLISGKEEARLIYMGVLWSMPELKERFSVIDIGGGSTELVVGDREKIYFSDSYKLGAARLTQRFFRKGEVGEESIRLLHEEVRAVMTPAASHIQALGPMPRLIGTSGTIQALARLDRNLDSKSGGESHGWIIKTDRLEKIVSEIKAAAQSGERLKSISSDRAQTILAGAIVLLETLRSLDVEELLVCSAALREGVVVDRFLQSGWLTGNLIGHRDPRSASVHDLLERYHGSFEHSAQVARLATEMFLQTQNVLHHYSREQGHLLWAAGILHDIGMFIGRNGHHKHSHYLIKHSGLVGYSEEEVEMIASIARYHRGSEPKESHEAFTSVPLASRQFVSQMASFLRIAEALDRSHRQIVTGLKVAVAEETRGISAPKEVKFELILPLDEDGQAEYWAFNEKKSLFEDQFNALATIEARAGFAFAIS